MRFYIGMGRDRAPKPKRFPKPLVVLLVGVFLISTGITGSALVGFASTVFLIIAFAVAYQEE